MTNKHDLSDELRGMADDGKWGGSPIDVSIQDALRRAADALDESLSEYDAMEGVVKRVMEERDSEIAHNAELRKVHDSDTETLLQVLRERDELRRQLEWQVDISNALQERCDKQAPDQVELRDLLEKAEARVKRLEDIIRLVANPDRDGFDEGCDCTRIGRQALEETSDG
jgi:hypothetical protein